MKKDIISLYETKHSPFIICYVRGGSLYWWLCGNKAHSVVLFGSDENFTKVTARHAHLV